jgi:hypothetical protein
MNFIPRNLVKYLIYYLMIERTSDSINEEINFYIFYRFNEINKPFHLEIY